MLHASQRVETSSYLDIEVQLGASCLDDARKVVDAELLGELVEHAELPCLGWVINGQLHTPHLHPPAAGCALVILICYW